LYPFTKYLIDYNIIILRPYSLALPQPCGARGLAPPKISLIDLNIRPL